MILKLDKLEILEEENNGEKKMEKDLLYTNTLQLLFPPIFPIKII